MKRLVLALALFAGAAHADFKNGNKLLEDMNETGSLSIGIVLGYVTGVIDATAGSLHCPPATSTAGQARDIVRKYLEENPAYRHLSASVLIEVALARHWPCEKKKKGESL